MAAEKPMGIALKQPESDTPRVQEMVVIHRIFRREFRLLAKLVRRVPDGHVKRARTIAEHADFVLMGLHNHHSSEDEYLWPKLLVRARPHVDLVERMERQHKAIAEHPTRRRPCSRTADTSRRPPRRPNWRRRSAR